jgi:hypothetical protein
MVGGACFGEAPEVNERMIALNERASKQGYVKPQEAHLIILF